MRTASFTSALIASIAEQEQWKIECNPEYPSVGRIIFPSGKITGFRESRLDINGLGASNISRDKAATHYFLGRDGFRTPKSRIVTSNSMMPAYEEIVNEFGIPFVVKPNSLSQAKGVTLVNTREAYLHACTEARSLDTVILIQQYAVGKHYRFTIFDEKVVLVYEKPAFWENDTIVAHDLEVHPKLAEILVRATESIGLVFAGLDVVITGDITQETVIENYMIIEINSAPSLRRYGSISNTAKEKVKKLYTDILYKIKDQ